MTPSNKWKKRYNLRDEILVKLFLLVAWLPLSLFILLVLILTLSSVFLLIPFGQVFEEDGKLSVKLPGFPKE